MPAQNYVVRTWAILIALTVSGGNEIANAQSVQPLFTPEEVAAYVPRGPSQTFRHFCSAFQMVDGKTDEFLSRGDPAAFAEFHMQLHADAAVVLAVPHEGYCTYPSRVGVEYPGLRNDWFGETIRELHKRRISAFGYITLGWNQKYLHEHPELGIPCNFGPKTICFNSPYLDLVEQYCREVLKNYPVDGLRFDILDQEPGCHCQGCRELFREEMPAQWSDDNWRRREEFRKATLLRAMRRLYQTCKAVKPAVEIWQNQLNLYYNVPLEGLAYADMAYMEWGDPFGQLFHLGTSHNRGVIVGKLENLGHAQQRLCMALGAHGYTYIMARHWDGLPPASEEEAAAWRKDRGWTTAGARENARSRGEIVSKLAPFFEMISRIEPYLVDARPVCHNVGVVFCEATRYRYKGFDRADYVKQLRQLGEVYLARSLPLEFIDSADLRKRNLAKLAVIVLPETSGLADGEINALRNYVRDGGTLILAGDALRYNQRGQLLPSMALGHELGISTDVRSSAQNRPSSFGKGQIEYLARPYATADLSAAIDGTAKIVPITVTPSGPAHQVILTRQEKQARWVLHLIGDGDYVVTIDRQFAPVHRIVGQFPSGGWSFQSTSTGAGLRIDVRGDAPDRLLVLE